MTDNAPPTLVRPGARPRSGFDRYVRRHVLALALPGVLLSDGLIIALAYLTCYMARFEWGLISPAPAPPFIPYLHASVLVAGVWTGCMALMGLYQSRRPASRFDDAVITGAGLSLGLLLTLSLSAFYRSFSYSRLVWAYAFVLSLLALTVWHLLLRALQAHGMRRGWGTFNTLIVGNNSLAAMVASRLMARPRLGHRVVGLVAWPDDAPTSTIGISVLGEVADLSRLITAHAIDEVIVAAPNAGPATLHDLIRSVTAHEAVGLQVAQGMVETMTTHLEMTSLDGLPMMAIRAVPLRKWHNRLLKRGVDVTLASGSLLAAAPLMGVLALLVKLSSAGSVFYAQERLGRDGRCFTIYKFRTMPETAEAQGPVWTKQGDERATRTGAFLRRFSLDELPQLWNVIKGDMSLVGPRPERPFFVDQFRTHVPKYMDRHLVRSGLTGWAQVNGLRGDVSIEERTRYDIHYVENWSLLLDLRIMLETVGAIFKRPGY